MNDFSLDGEITFWLRQLSEHVEFEVAALDVNDPNNGPLFALGKELTAAFARVRRRRVPDHTIVNLLDSLRGFEETLLRESGKRYIGLLFPSMVEHHLDELDHLEQELIGGTKRDLLGFYAHMHKEHAELAHHLIDPTETEKLEMSKQVAEALGALEKEAKDLISASLVDAARRDFYMMESVYAEIVDGVTTRTLASIISPKLALHIQREGLRSEAALRALFPR